MDSMTTMSTPIGQKIEVYTELFLITGLLTLSSGRTSDVLNRANTEFIALHDAGITPLGQPPNPKPMEHPVMVRRTLINFVTDASQNKPAPPKPPVGTSGNLLGREAYVHKVSLPCYALTGPFAIYGQCYLHQGTSLENLLQSVDIFFPITKATIYVLNRPNLTWQRDLVILNKMALLSIYLLPQPEIG